MSNFYSRFSKNVKNVELADAKTDARGYDVFQDWSNRITPPNRTTDLSFDRRFVSENPFAHILILIKDDDQKKVD